MKITMQRALRIKAALGLSLRGRRLLFEELRDLGCSIEGERKQIKLGKETVKDFVEVGNKHFRKEDLSETTKEPFASIKNLTIFINQHLDHLDEKGLLVWDETMNKDSVLVKIGADHGKKSS